jgi:putative nucleotidyltransferase with HDIG domain
MGELDKYIDRVKHLPPAPRLLPRLLTLLRQTDINVSKVVEVITFDQSLTANVLKMCNSAYIGAASPADNLDEAVTRLGFDNVYCLVAAVSARRVMSPALRGYDLDEVELWKHSVATALAAQLMARDKGDDEAVAFTAGLLHDVGKVILPQALEQTYRLVVAESRSNQSSLLETETKLLGVNHAEIGGRLLERWEFPANLIAAVSFHHKPVDAKPHDRLAAYVYLGNMIAHFLGYAYGQHAFGFCGRAESLDLLQITRSDFAGYTMQTSEGFQAVEKLFTIKTDHARVTKLQS